MITIRQLAAALYGLGLLLKLDPRAFEYFEKTPGGFARSFVVAAALAPLHIIHAILSYSEKDSLAFTPYVVVETLSYVLSWVLFPFAMLYVSDFLQRSPRYFWHMVPYNWFQLAAGLLLLPVTILADLGALPMQLAAFLNLLALSVFFTYAAFIARFGLQVGIGTGIALVVLDLLLNLLSQQLIAKI